LEFSNEQRKTRKSNLRMIRRVGALGVFRRLSRAPFLAAERVISVIPFEKVGKNFPSTPSPKKNEKCHDS
jgi:hypothetical protein